MRLIMVEILAAALVVCCGCSSLVPKYYTNSNAIAITKQVNALPFSEVSKHIRAGSKVTIKNLEVGVTDMTHSGPYSLDSTVHYVIEQTITEHMLAKGVIVLERDPHVLSAAMTERGKSYTIKVPNPAADTGEDDHAGQSSVEDNDETDVDVTIVNQASDSSGDSGKYSKSSRYKSSKSSKSAGSAASVANEPAFIDVSTGFSTADFIVGYRIIDCGIYNQPSPLDQVNIFRVAKCALHVRVSSTKSSAIIYAGTLERTAEDMILAPAYQGHIEVIFDPADFTHPDTPVKESDGGLSIPGGFFGF